LSTTLEYVDPLHGNVPYIMETKKLSKVTRGSRVPMESFKTPFLGEDVESIKAWFRSNIEESQRPYFTDSSFIILDDMSAETDTCIVVSLWEPALATMRVEFILAVATAQAVENSDCGFTDDYVEMFRKNGGVMTNDNIKLAQSNGLQISGGEVLRDEDWYDPDNDFRCYYPESHGQWDSPTHDGQTKLPRGEVLRQLQPRDLTQTSNSDAWDRPPPGRTGVWIE